MNTYDEYGVPGAGNVGRFQYTGQVWLSKLERGILEPENRLTMEEWTSGDRIWLVDLVAPFATAENQQRELMLADLIAGPLAGKAFSFHETDPKTGSRRVRNIDADAAEKLTAAIKAAVDAES